MWTLIQVLLFFIWLGCIPAFIAFWWKKRKARIAAGEDYKNNSTYKKMSSIKRSIGITFIAITVFMIAIPPNSETEKSTASSNEKNLVAEKAEQERLAAEKAEQERLAAEKAEQEKLAAEKAEQEKLAAEKAEQERLAAEKAEQEKLAAEKAEQERLAAEKAEQEKLAAEKVEQERLAAKKAEQERLADEKFERQKAELKQNLNQIEDKAKEIKDTVVEKATDYANKTMEDKKKEAAEITADEILVSSRTDESHDSIIELYILPKTVEPLMDGIIFETREGFTIKVKVKINGADGYLKQYDFYNHNNFFESEDKVYYSEWDQKYFGDEEHFHGDGRQWRITNSSTALEIYRASKKFSLIR